MPREGVRGGETRGPSTSRSQQSTRPSAPPPLIKPPACGTAPGKGACAERKPSKVQEGRPSGPQNKGPSAGGTFASSAAGSAVGTMVGSALSKSPGAPEGGVGPEGMAGAVYYGPCAEQFAILINCADNNGGDLSQCKNHQKDLAKCITSGVMN